MTLIEVKTTVFLTYSHTELPQILSELKAVIALLIGEKAALLPEK